MKKFISFITVLILLLPVQSVKAAELTVDDSISSVILMEASSGAILYEKDADLELAPASVTKVMTMLLIMEAIDNGVISYSDMVTASANAASMGGSQVYLKEGEQFSVTDMLKSITMASANDACVAMAEHLCGSEEAFVQKMNERAAQLGMTHTSFENTNGLDDTTTAHYTSARDIAVMSRELITKHPDILDFTSVWMDSVRNGEFGLTNTNRLVRFYKGANGLKTGSTSKAGFCISASAERDGMQLICVIMKAPDRDTRNEAAKRVLDYGFANYTLTGYDDETLISQKVFCGIADNVCCTVEGFDTVLPKGDKVMLEREIILDNNITAPVTKGQRVGTVRYTVDGELLYEGSVTADTDVKKITYFGLVSRIFKKFLSI